MPRTADNFAEGCELSKDGEVTKRAHSPRMATDDKLTQEDEVAKKDNVTAAGKLAKEDNFAKKATSHKGRLHQG
jgi:hypothetical protein